MATLSAVVIAFNEEENIGDCLDRLSFTDEVVVLDSGSTDRTVEICRDKGASVHHRDWDGYSNQRNAAHDLAAMDWILVVDADERVSPELAREIKALLADPPADKAGFEILRRVYYQDKWLRHGGFYPEYVTRLFRKGLGRCPERMVHEAIEVDGPVGRLEGHLDHYTYRSVSDYLDRMQRYSTLSAREYHKQGRTTGPVRMTFRAWFTFFQMYVLRLGFLDGYAGFLLAVLYGYYTFVKYAKLYELRREQ